MIWFIAAIIVGLLTWAIARTALKKQMPEQDWHSNIARREAEDNVRAVRAGGKAVAVLGTLLTITFLALSVFYIQSSGTVKIITRFGGDVVAADTSIGMGVKAPWDSAKNWDMFTRDISLSEPAQEFEEKFERGEITGSRIATSVRSGEDSGAQVWFDLDVTYDFVTDEDAYDTPANPETGAPAIDYEAADFVALYTKYRDQDRFTRQIIYPELMKAANTVPSEYTTTEFRGAGSVEAADKIATQVNMKLAKYGIHIGVASVKNVDFTEAVEKSLSSVEEKQQQEESARADAAAKQVQNEQMIKDAKAKAEANKIESDSLTPELLQLRQIEGYKKGDTFYIPQGTDLLISPK